MNSRRDDELLMDHFPIAVGGLSQHTHHICLQVKKTSTLATKSEIVSRASVGCGSSLQPLLKQM